MKQLAFIFIAAIAFTSCDTKNLVYDKSYFDFDSLVQKQIHLLTNAKTKIDKKSELNGKKDSISFVPDMEQWKYELEAFAQLDAINKPYLKNAYQTNEVDDEHSNLRRRNLTSTIKAPVPEIRFYYLNSKLKRIEATFEEENLMMTTSRKLILEFDGDRKEEMMTHYFIGGKQKMIFSNSVLYSVEGKVNF